MFVRRGKRMMNNQKSLNNIYLFTRKPFSIGKDLVMTSRFTDLFLQCDDILEEHHDTLIDLLVTQNKNIQTSQQLAERFCVQMNRKNIIFCFLCTYFIFYVTFIKNIVKMINQTKFFNQHQYHHPSLKINQKNNQRNRTRMTYNELLFR